MTGSSYRTIFTSTALIGVAQIIFILAGIVRTKVLALLLGPAGVGAVGLYTTAAELIGTITGMGIGGSGVRQIAEATGGGEENRIARTTITVRRAALLSAVLGMLAVLILCNQLSWLTFGDTQHTWGIALMSLTVLFSGISAGQIALLQGFRRIKELASSQILGALFGCAVGIAVIYVLREDGIVPYLVAVSAFGTLTSWWYGRRIRVPPTALPVQEIVQEFKLLLGMGAAFMVSALLVAGVAYASRVLILRELGNEAVGLYQATWTLSTLYVGFVLNTMAMDFYPRLTVAACDNRAVNRMVNEQTEMGLLIAIPGVLATITLAPWVMMVFYSSYFLGAVEIIRWQIIGIALRVVCWPLGFVQLAKGRGTVFILTETLGSFLHITLLILGMNHFGLEGVGIAFAVFYFCYTVGIYFTCRWLSGFEWTQPAKKILFLSGAVVALTFLAVRHLPDVPGMACGVILTLVASVVCLQSLQKRLGETVWGLVRTKFRER